MRILLPNHFPLEGSGSGIYTQNVARQLERQGHNALVITPAHEPQEGFPFEVRSILFSPAGEARDGEYRLPFNFPCFTTHPISTTRYAELNEGQRERYIQAFEDEIQRAVEDWSPDLIHAQHLWVAPYAASKTGVPYIATAHGTDLMGYREYPHWRAIAEQGVRKARMVIAVSRQVAAEAKQIYGLPEGRVRVVMNGFDQNIFRPISVDIGRLLRRHGISSEPEALITFVGKLTRFKGVDVLLEAAGIYEREFEGALTLIVGDGELRGRLEAQAVDLGLKGVRFLGHLSQVQVAELLNAADVSVVPSRVEPFGLVAVEALACGTPVVATNEGGLPEFVDERVGALVDVGDPHGLADAILREVCTDAKGRKGAFAAEYALKRFSWSGRVAEIIELYEQVLRSDERTASAVL